MYNEEVNKVDEQLTGERNARLHSVIREENSYTEAIFDEGTECQENNVTIPDIEGVLDAKDWVDSLEL